MANAVKILTLSDSRRCMVFNSNCYGGVNGDDVDTSIDEPEASVVCNVGDMRPYGVSIFGCHLRHQLTNLLRSATLRQYH